jgi:hypothetical protein
MLMRKPQPQHTPPRMSQNKNLFPMKPVTEIVHYFKSVLFHLQPAT